MTPAEAFAARKRENKTGLPEGTSPLRVKRVSVGLTVYDVAEVMGVAVATVSRWETDGFPSLPDAYKLARFFGCTVYDLWPDKGPEPNTEASGDDDQAAGGVEGAGQRAG